MEIGKHGKLKGELHPRDLRRIDPEPPRPTPKKGGSKPKPLKRFGYSYERRPWSWGQNALARAWKRVYVWFDTPRSRDQAIAVRIRQAQNFERDFRKEERSSERTANAVV